MNPEDLLRNAMHDHAATVDQPLDTDRLNGRLHHADNMVRARRTAFVACGAAVLVLASGIAYASGHHGEEIRTASPTETTSSIATDHEPGHTTHPHDTPGTSTTVPATPPDDGSTTTVPYTMPSTTKPPTYPTTTTPYDYPTTTKPYTYPTTTAPPTYPTTTPTYPTTTHPTTTTTSPTAPCVITQMNTSSSGPNGRGYWKIHAPAGTTFSAMTPADTGWITSTQTAPDTADGPEYYYFAVSFSTSMPANQAIQVYVGCVESQHKESFTFTWNQ